MYEVRSYKVNLPQSTLSVALCLDTRYEVIVAVTKSVEDRHNAAFTMVRQCETNFELQKEKGSQSSFHTFEYREQKSAKESWKKKISEQVKQRKCKSSFEVT